MVHCPECDSTDVDEIDDGWYECNECGEGFSEDQAEIDDTEDDEESGLSPEDYY